MADQLATTSDLANALQMAVADLDSDVATLLLEASTSVVQEAAGGQRIVEVADDAISLIGLTGSWLDLPQIPVTAVSAVTLDGTALTAGSPGDAGTTYRRHGNRLWRTNGWQTYCGEPSDVSVTCTHGYASGSQKLQLGRAITLSLSKGMYVNPSGVASERIDDYAVSYTRAVDEAAGMLTDSMRVAIRRAYGRPGNAVRLS